ncbi:MAG: gamma-glutamyltransferase [Actinomycetota bacterium]|nr:gamma-glutamyltransferase [Actinomycetota bacterium]
MRRILSVAFVLSITVSLGLAPSTPAKPSSPQGRPTATGRGGAAASVDPLATRTAIRVLRRGGNAVDAAVAAAAVLGVVEPYSCGIGGGGFMLIGRGDKVATNDHRETAPGAYEADTLIDPDTGEPIPFEEAVTSGLSVGVPGTVRGWDRVLERFGSMSLSSVLQPAITIAREGFVVDDLFASQTRDNLKRFRSFTSTRRAFLTEGGGVPRVGSVFRNRDLARTYDLIAERGADAFYQGKLARAIARTVQDPPETRSSDLEVRPGLMTAEDLAGYRAPFRPPTRVSYRGYDVFGMGPPSSGGSTISEALNILEGFELGTGSRTRALHHYIEATSLAFADRNAYLGDADFVDVPLAGLLSQEFAAERRELIGPEASLKPLPPGDPFPYDHSEAAGSASSSTRGSTTHVTVSDSAGMVVSYTFTIEQIGGSAITVPEYGFLLNNELTDFNFEPPHPNAPEGGKRPRSSMSPTIVTQGGKTVVALGSPGGSTIINTVLQVLLNRLDFRMTLPEAVAAPRLAPQNAYPIFAEPAFLSSEASEGLEDLGHSFEEIEELGAVAGIEFLSGGRVRAVGEPVRRGGGSAAVERP